MSTFVLVHGAWHGGWCWERVARRLRAQGHQVLSPTLTGLAERAEEATRQTSLETHILDIVAVLDGCQGSDDIVLVGHSYGGMVITGAADRRPSVLRRLVYLDAFLPQSGQSQWDMMAPAAKIMFSRSAEEFGDGWRIPAPWDVQGLGVIAPLDQAWVRSLLTPHPLRTFLDPLHLTGEEIEGQLRRYIGCIRDTTPFTALHASMRTDPTWEFRELAAGHDAMITEPRKVAELLAQCDSPGAIPRAQ